MKGIFKGLIFIFTVAAIILFSDLSSRKEEDLTKIVNIAVFKLASRPVLDDSEKGFMDYLRENGYDADKNIEGIEKIIESRKPDVVASLIINRKYEYVYSISTPALQTMAAANTNGDVIHLFSTVTDPYTAGVGIKGPEPDQRPAWLTGLGTFQPVERSIAIALQINPDLKSIGTVWCASEVCSEMCVLKARKFCADHGLELEEMVIDNSNMVVEATNAVLMRGVDALWIGGDNVVELAIDQLIGAARKAGVPVFTNTPNHATKGALFGVGADYYNVGRAAGKMMAEILDGADPSSFRIDNVVPEELVVNPGVAEWAGDQWTLPQEIILKAKKIVE